ncbi:hypothetical protein GCM10025854_17830 [Tetragenococcus muriaticus]|uniref:Putative SAM-dependent methyltransferase n=1 Tax=Tetragenococcus muriaticus 3MR10-3 TaxID=1302648 RepID=A0A091C1Y2_9ENTE|nr:putative SAM-dependent methyltransferase [Tetragenococcus muriaticus 3MR10-3]GMA47533.1 hypothetical protein GCM10025854_17830 [Tetragenococcus muriaticus]
MEIKVTQQAAKRIRRGYPLLQKRDLLDPIKENQWINFVDKQQNLVAKGYLGVQNNGVGWCLTTNDRPLDYAFFVELFLKQEKNEKTTIKRKKQMPFVYLMGQEII